jgi:hypothetical protein
MSKTASGPVLQLRTTTLKFFRSRQERKLDRMFPCVRYGVGRRDIQCSGISRHMGAARAACAEGEHGLVSW